MKTQLIIALSLLLVSGNVLAWGDDWFCTPKDVVEGICHKGDLLYAGVPLAVLKFCDFDKKVVSHTGGDASSIRGGAYCFYRGSARERRVAPAPTGIIDRFDKSEQPTGLVNPFSKYGKPK